MDSHPDPCGYPLVNIYADGTAANKKVHQLVAAAFIGKVPEGLECHHLNGVKTDNRARNLGYISHAANVAHAFQTGLADGEHCRGSKQHLSKLTESEVLRIRELLSNGKRVYEVAELFGVNWSTIDRILKRETWGWLD